MTHVHEDYKEGITVRSKKSKNEIVKEANRVRCKNIQNKSKTKVKKRERESRNERERESVCEIEGERETEG